nr:DUF948 domain-containing protein [Ancylothrix sp. D3o]
MLVAASLTAVLIAAIPALQEIGRAARSIEKLADTLSRELPPTLEAIRLTGLEITELTDDVTEGVESASQVVKQVDQSLGTAKQQVKKVQITTKSFLTGFQTAWKTFTRPNNNPDTARRSAPRLNTGQKPPLDIRDRLPPPDAYTSDPYRQNSPNHPPPSSLKPPHFEDDLEPTDHPPQP